MKLSDAQALSLLAAARLGISSRRLQLLACGQDAELREWIARDRGSEFRKARAYADSAADRLQSMGAKLVSLGEPGYPAGLRALPDPPAFLTYLGTIDFDGITIIGTRTPTPRAAGLAHDVAYLLTRSTISGLARGIDAAVHRGSLDARQPTLAYVGTGIGRTYPAPHRELQDEIVGSGGGIASELLPDQAASESTLVRRDRLQAAHGAGVLLIASDARGGAMHTMWFAQRLRKCRFALDDPEPAWEGNRRAISDGAVPLPFDAAEIVRQLHGATAP